jgi:ADP-dependent NAD(P)H-hydrate dehydratase / NAD(P)H-hydrate epimerase
MLAHLKSEFPSEVYLANEVRELDRVAIEEYGIAGIELMERASRFALHTLLKFWPKTEHIAVLCGAGNNAGDGYLLAALAKKRNIDCVCYYLSDPSLLKGDAKTAFEMSKAQHVKIVPFNPHASFSETNLGANAVIVDALLGTGLNRAVSSEYIQAIEACNASSLPVLAIDIPSGLSANTGKPQGIAIEADITATFIGNKLGLMTGEGRQYSGAIIFDSLKLPCEVRKHVRPSIHCLNLSELLERLPKRARNSHKGKHGHTLLIGGNEGFGGAIILATQAAARMGGGLLSVITRPANSASVLQGTPEAMTHAVTEPELASTVINKATVIGIGPGLGKDKWAETLLKFALESNSFLVIDADALNMIAANPALKHQLKQRSLTQTQGSHLITPHPGEAARLLNSDTHTIENDRLEAVKKLQNDFGGHALLKGSGTLIAHPSGKLSVNPYGNPGMASGGMGDTLTGIIAGLMSNFQGLDTELLCELACCLHACAADMEANENGELGMLASDLPKHARRLLNKLGTETDG